jgi:hypothetical protein
MKWPKKVSTSLLYLEIFETFCRTVCNTSLLVGIIMFYNKNIGREGCGQDKAVEMWKPALQHVTPTMWENSIWNTNKIIDNWWERELTFDREKTAPLIIINLGEDDDSDDEESDTEETDLDVVPL